MFPDYSMFKIKLDEPSKSAANMLKREFTAFLFRKDVINPKIEALKSFRKTASDKLRYSLQIHYYAFTNLEDERSEEEKETDLYFSLILIDRDYYGYK